MDSNPVVWMVAVDVGGFTASFIHRPAGYIQRMMSLPSREDISNADSETIEPTE